MRLRKTKISKDEIKGWTISDKIGMGTLFVGIVGLVVNAIIIIFTYCALEEAKKNTKTAQDALALQQKQSIESQKQDSIRNVQDSLKTAKFIQLSEQQILALKGQASALERGVKNTEISQALFLDIARLGFQIANINDPDGVILLYKVNNYGYRPSILKTTKVFILNKDFKLISKHKTTANTILTKEKNFQETIRLFFGENECLICDIDDILNSGNIYFSFVLEYTDPFMSHHKIIKGEPIFYKWVKRNRSEMIKYGTSGNDMFYSADLCKNQDETSKIFDVVKINKD